MVRQFNLEGVYDDQIAPLMAEIIQICKTHKLPMFAVFQYEATDEEQGNGYVRTRIPADGENRELFDDLQALSGRNINAPLVATINDDCA